MPKLSEEHLDWLCENVPEPSKSPLGGRPPHDKRQAIAGIFWSLDHGAKWKDLPKEFGPKSTVHRWFRRWVEAGVFEELLRTAGACVEEQGGFKLYECFVDGGLLPENGSRRYESWRRDSAAELSK